MERIRPDAQARSDGEVGQNIDQSENKHKNNLSTLKKHTSGSLSQTCEIAL
jgi:hypothetical protein